MKSASVFAQCRLRDDLRVSPGRQFLGADYMFTRRRTGYASSFSALDMEIFQLGMTISPNLEGQFSISISGRASPSAGLAGMFSRPKGTSALGLIP